jgi:hypothetical protein
MRLLYSEAICSQLKLRKMVPREAFTICSSLNRVFFMGADDAPAVEIIKKHGVGDVAIYAWRKRFGKLAQAQGCGVSIRRARAFMSVAR